MARTRRLLGILVAAALVPLLGCTNYVKDMNVRIVEMADVAKRAPNAVYIVEPPDVVRVEFPNDPELTRDQVVRPDGCITLPLVEDVQVSGMTTMQIRQQLEELYARYHKEPDVLVSVADYRSKRIFIYGEVRRVGPQPYTGHMTMLDALGHAGGLTRHAAWGRVRVARGDPESPDVFKVDLDRLLLEGDNRQEVTLADNDVIYVPPNALAWFGYQIQALLFPAQSAVSLTDVPGNVGGN